jgi:hypothetical protein
MRYQRTAPHFAISSFLLGSRGSEFHRAHLVSMSPERATQAGQSSAIVVVGDVAAVELAAENGGHTSAGAGRPRLANSTQYCCTSSDSLVSDLSKAL